MSQYPSLASDVALEFYSRLPDDLLSAELEEARHLKGVGQMGSACQVGDFAAFLKRWSRLREDSGLSRPVVEGKLACSLYDLLSSAPKEALEDLGYWRWVAAVPLRHVVLWQGSKVVGQIPNRDAFGTNAISHAGAVNALPYRMYLRGALATDAQRLEPTLNREEIAESGGNSIWGTEILRRKGLGSYPLCAVAFLNEAIGKPVPLYRAAVTHLERLGAQVSRLEMSYLEAIQLTKDAFNIAEQELAQKKVSRS
jgi:hypothetical protein